MSDPLNFFEPYENIPAHHENQLTRALLVVLRYSPMAHQAWLFLVDPKLKLHQLPSPRFRTQQAKILEKHIPTSGDEAIKGISVICAADALEVNTQTQPSDRGQVLDGIIRYEDDLVIVLETKLDGPVSTRQAREINLHGQPVAFQGKVRPLSWRSILDAFADLVDDTRGVTAGSERRVLQDFLEFADRNFPNLGPYSTLDRCGGETSRIMHRLGRVISEATGGETIGNGALLPGKHSAVVSVHFGCEREGDEQCVYLGMYPADTLDQARVLYTRPKAPDRLLNLISNGWEITPNFHFGFMAKGLCHTTATAGVKEYVKYWKKNIGKAKQIDRAEWTAYWKTLVKLGFARRTDREQFDRDFTSTGRQFASPRPGLGCFHSWPLPKAVELDAKSKFIQAVRKRINQLLKAIDEPTL